jgi:hypothetical protein
MPDRDQSRQQGSNLSRCRHVVSIIYFAVIAQVIARITTAVAAAAVTA